MGLVRLLLNHSGEPPEKRKISAAVCSASWVNAEAIRTVGRTCRTSGLRSMLITIPTDPKT